MQEHISIYKAIVSFLVNKGYKVQPICNLKTSLEPQLVFHCFFYDKWTGTFTLH